MSTKTTSIDAEYITRTNSAYDNIAEAYAETWFNDQTMKPALGNFLNHLAVSGAILDAGCGPGRDVLAITDQGYETVGIDISSAMIKEARSRVPESIFRRMDMRSLIYPSGSFAGIWACASLQHLPPRRALEALLEFKRILKPQGLLCVIVEEGQGECIDHLGRYRKFYAETELHELITKNGFQILSECVEFSNKVTLGEDAPRKWLHVLAMKSGTPTNQVVNEEEKTCPFCPTSRFQLQQKFQILGTASILWGNDDMYIVPDIAPLLDGHLLIVTTSHYDCYGALPENFNTYINIAKNRIRQMFRDVYHEEATFFEHGSTQYKEAGACINHAHWHCLPTSLPLRKAVEKQVGSGKVGTLDTLRGLYRDKQSYLYIEEKMNEGFVYLTSVLPCQFLREVIGSMTGNNNWGWQLSFRLDESKRAFRRTLDSLIPLADDLL